MIKQHVSTVEFLLQTGKRLIQLGMNTLNGALVVFIFLT